MQDYANSKRLPLKTILFFGVVVFLAYLPVSSCLFFLKNDAFNGYFPPKFFMSESISAGHLPLWNPYINFGIPQYGDMSSGYWSPFTWLIAGTVGYNAYSLTFELLFYIFLSGIGMYLLSGLWVKQAQVRVIAGMAYMCSGYHIGHLQHFNWLSGAAFLPLAFWSYRRLLEEASLRNFLFCSLMFYMLLASAHPGLSIAGFYLFAIFFIFDLFTSNRSRSLVEKMKFSAKTHLYLSGLLLLLCAGMLAGYLDIIPHFARGEKLALAESLGDPTNLQSWISALLPLATVKNDQWYRTDISMRNCFFSLTVLLFFLRACAGKMLAIQKFLLACGTGFALLASAGVFKTMAYHILPFIGFVRLNGEFSIFAILCFILLGAIELEKQLTQPRPFSGYTRSIYYLLEILLAIAILYGGYHAFVKHESVLFSMNNILAKNGLSLKLKASIDGIQFYDCLWIQGLIQLLFLWAIKYSLRKNKLNMLLYVTIGNIMIASLMNIPFTGVGKASVADVQKVLDKSPPGIPIPSLQPIRLHDTIPSDEKELVGDWSLYSKQIGVGHPVPYPIALNNMKQHFDDSAARENLNRPFLYLLPGGTGSTVDIPSFTPNSITAHVQPSVASLLVLQQNHYPHWYYQSGNNHKPVLKFGSGFMAAPVTLEQTNIRFIFEPMLVVWMMLLSAVAFFIFCIALITLSVKPPGHQQ